MSRSKFVDLVSVLQFIVVLPLVFYYHLVVASDNGGNLVVEAVTAVFAAISLGFFLYRCEDYMSISRYMRGRSERFQCVVSTGLPVITGILIFSWLFGGFK